MKYMYSYLSLISFDLTIVLSNEKTCEDSPLRNSPLAPWHLSTTQPCCHELKFKLQAPSILPRSSVYSHPTSFPWEASTFGNFHPFLFWSNKKMLLKHSLVGGENQTSQRPQTEFFPVPETETTGPPTMWRTKVDQLPSYRPPWVGCYGWVWLGGWVGKKSRGCFSFSYLDLERMGFWSPEMCVFLMLDGGKDMMMFVERSVFC